jgi:hypothetical protein
VKAWCVFWKIPVSVDKIVNHIAPKSIPELQWLSHHSKEEQSREEAAQLTRHLKQGGLLHRINKLSVPLEQSHGHTCGAVSRVLVTLRKTQICEKDRASNVVEQQPEEEGSTRGRRNKAHLANGNTSVPSRLPLLTLPISSKALWDLSVEQLASIGLVALVELKPRLELGPLTSQCSQLLCVRANNVQNKLVLVFKVDMQPLHNVTALVRGKS